MTLLKQTIWASIYVSSGKPYYLVCLRSQSSIWFEDIQILAASAHLSIGWLSSSDKDRRRCISSLGMSRLTWLAE
jgi:hypothetical protein